MHNQRTIRAALAASKGNIYQKTYMFPNCPTPPLQKHLNLKGLPNKKKYAFENRLYLGEFEAEFKKARES
jgi:hypothetical protein